jgi:hypothetical protein
VYRRIAGWSEPVQPRHRVKEPGHDDQVMHSAAALHEDLRGANPAARTDKTPAGRYCFDVKPQGQGGRVQVGTVLVVLLLVLACGVLGAIQILWDLADQDLD